MSFDWRLLREADLPGVAAIAAIAFPKHHEDQSCFAERLALSPSWCFGLEDGAGVLKGYMIAYRWPLGSIPPLNAPLGALPQRPGALFLHDLALHPDAVGTGQASAGVELLAQRAGRAGFTAIALVAVNDTGGFWRRLQFVAEPGSPAMRAKLATYGDGARYMRRALAG